MGNFGRRKEDRYNLKVDARLRVYDTSGSTIENHESFYTIRNICAGGAYMDTDRPLQVGTKVDVFFHLSVPGSSIPGNSSPDRQSSVAVTGLVVRNEPSGMAVQFNRNYSISSV